MGQRCLIIGASGQLGRALCAEFQSRYDVVGSANRRAQPGQWCIDLSDFAATVATIREVKPVLILIAGAFCNVDQAESECDTAFAVNRDGPAAVAACARTLGATVVYYSTDYVFDGTRDRYMETDPLSPLNVYAQSKAQGEEAIRALLPNQHLVIRTAWLYGPDHQRRNFVLRLIDEIRAGHTVRVPHDQWGAPTYTEDLAAATRQLLERGHVGIFHATGPEFVDRVSFAQRVCASFDLDGTCVKPLPTGELGQVAVRPLRVHLNCQKLHATRIGEFRRIEVGLKALQRWDEQLSTSSFPISEAGSLTKRLL